MRRLTFLFLAAATVAACTTTDHDVELTLPQTEANVVGAFNLSTANGRVLPYQAILTNTEVWSITADRIVLDAKGTWTDTTSYSVLNRIDGSTIGKGSASSGTYAIANGQINFTMTAGGNAQFVGAVTGNTLQLNYNGLRFVYTK